tara:strand:- start:1660 stop:1815 length:156 start_codon:yes stop_codon:yes gene_type:complete
MMFRGAYFPQEVILETVLKYFEIDQKSKNRLDAQKVTQIFFENLRDVKLKT